MAERKRANKWIRQRLGQRGASNLDVDPDVRD